MSDLDKRENNDLEKESRVIKSKKEKYMNNLNMEAKASIKARMITALILIVILVPAVFLGNYVYAGVILVFSLIAANEIVRTPQSIEKKYGITTSIVAYITMIVIVFYRFDHIDQ